jgi:Winged helix DNA-binding domain
LLLADDEQAMRATATASAPARLLPSGDAYFLLHGAGRELLVPQPDRRQQLWTPRVWPGALLVDGEVRGTWRRAQHTVRIDPWGRVSRGMREAVEAEARSLPLPGLDRNIEVLWNA